MLTLIFSTGVKPFSFLLLIFLLWAFGFFACFASMTLGWSRVARCQSFRPGSKDTPKASPQAYVNPTLAHMQRFPIEH